MRIFQIIIVVFWLASMAWLTKTMLTPDEAGMVEVDPRRPVQIFFNLNDTNRMVLLQNGQRMGEIELAGFSEDENGDLAGFSAALMLNGDVSPKIMGTFARGLFRFTDTYQVDTSEFSFRMPSNNLRVQASAKHGDEIVKANVSLAGNTLFSYDGSELKDLPPGFESILENNSIATDLLEKTGDPEQWKPKIEAFRGKHRFDGKRLPVYLIRLSMEQTDETVRIYISEAGEPLKIDTDLGFQAVSEILAPIRKTPLQREAEFFKNQ